MTTAEMKTALVKASVRKDGRLRISCATLFKLNGTFKVTLKRIGKICDDTGIKIIRCQLGCFE